MAKIAFLGDTHFSGQSPISRKETNEQYRKTILDKMNSIKEICVSNGINTLIITGDVFNNNSSVSNYFETELWKMFLDFRNSNIEVYSIVGNHDYILHNDNEFKGTYLYKAYLAGIIKHLDTLIIDGVSIKGFDFKRDFIQSDNSKYSIAVAHSFYENELYGGTGNENLTNSMCKSLGYSAYVLGHDHQYYPTIEDNGSIIVRPGSLIRGTSKTCNLYRDVHISVFNTEPLEWEDIKLPIKLGTDVFKEKVIMSKNMDFNLEKLLEDFTSTKGLSIYDILDQQKEQGQEKLGKDYKNIVKLITDYCESVGIYNHNKSMEANSDY